MKRRALVGSLVLLILSTTDSGMAELHGDSAPRQVALEAVPATVTFGEPTLLRGVVTASPETQRECVEDVEVVIEGCPHSDIACSPDRVEIGRVRTDAEGGFEFVDRPYDRTQYWARVEPSSQPDCESARSSTVVVDVRFRVRIRSSDRVVRSGETVRFRVSVQPYRADLPPDVQLQQRRNGRFVTVAAETTRKWRRSFVFRQRLREDGTFRGFAEHDTFHDRYLPGHSKPKRTRVREI